MSLTVEDIIPLDDYLAQRRQLQARALEAKAPRRIAVGPNITLLFENRLTVQWQVQEMCRVEGLRSDKAIAQELDAYNPLLPSSHELSATMLIEYDDESERREMLVKLSGLHNHLWLHFSDAGRAQAVFEDGREREDTGKVSSVQFIRIPLNEAQLAALGSLASPVSLVIDHPAYQAEAPLSAAQRGALLDDLKEASA